MLSEWLAPDDLSWFMREQFQTAPFARPGAASRALGALDWTTVDRILRSDKPLDVMTVRAGQLYPVPVPRSLEAARALMQAGISVVVRGAEQHDAGLRAVADGFQAALPGEVHIQVRHARRHQQLRLALRLRGRLHRADRRHQGLLLPPEHGGARHRAG